MAKFSIWYQLNNGNVLVNTLEAINKDKAWNEIRNMWFGYNPEMKQIKKVK